MLNKTEFEETAGIILSDPPFTKKACQIHNDIQKTFVWSIIVKFVENSFLQFPSYCFWNINPVYEETQWNEQLLTRRCLTLSWSDKALKGTVVDRLTLKIQGESLEITWTVS